MYLNEKKTGVTLIYAKIQMIIGIVFTVFWGFGVVGGIADYADLRSGVFIYLILMLPFVWLVWLSRQKRLMVEKARLLNQIFRADTDGEIPASNLVRPLGSKNEYEAVKTVGLLIGKGFLTNCTIEQQPHVRVVLHRKMEGTMIAVECPSCGAKLEKREGFSIVCPYCGTKIS